MSWKQASLTNYLLSAINTDGVHHRDFNTGKAPESVKRGKQEEKVQILTRQEAL